MDFVVDLIDSFAKETQDLETYDVPFDSFEHIGYEPVMDEPPVREVDIGLTGKELLR